MAGSRRGRNEPYSVHISDVVAADQIAIITGIDCGRPHVFVGVQLFQDPAGLVRAFPTGGTLRIQVKTLAFGPTLEDPPNNVIDMNNLRTIDWAANTLEVHAFPNQITAAPFYRIQVVANEA